MTELEQAIANVEVARADLTYARKAYAEIQLAENTQRKNLYEMERQLHRVEKTRERLLLEANAARYAAQAATKNKS